MKIKNSKSVSPHSEFETSLAYRGPYFLKNKTSILWKLNIFCKFFQAASFPNPGTSKFTSLSQEVSCCYSLRHNTLPLNSVKCLKNFSVHLTKAISTSLLPSSKKKKMFYLKLALKRCIKFLQSQSDFDILAQLTSFEMKHSVA